VHDVGTGFEGVDDGHLGDLTVEAAELMGNSLKSVKVVLDTFGGTLWILKFCICESGGMGPSHAMTPKDGKICLCADILSIVRDVIKHMKVGGLYVASNQPRECVLHFNSAIGINGLVLPKRNRHVATSGARSTRFETNVGLPSVQPLVGVKDICLRGISNAIIVVHCV
jgi:hypothetical protein